MNRTRDRLLMAYGFAQYSQDISTQNGAVLFSPAGGRIGFGWNRIVPMDCATPERLQRPLKYTWTEHAERDAIFNAVSHGFGALVPGSTLYCPWLACADCGRAIVGCGVRKVVRHRIPQHDERPDWLESIKAADEMFRVAGVEVEEYREPLGVEFRFNGSMIRV